MPVKVHASLVAMVVTAWSASVSAQTWPTRPIRIIASAAGGSGDLVSLQIAQAISARMGQPVVVENGSSGNIPARLVARSKPDGYTLLMGGGAIWLSEFLVKDTP